MALVRTPEQVTAAIDAERNESAKAAAAYVQKPEMDALARHVIAAYEANKAFRSEEIDNILLEDLRQLNGEYDPDKLSDLKREGQPTVFFPATAEKVRGAVAWVLDVVNFDNGKPFTLAPTPIPDLTPDAIAEIAEQAEVDVQAFLANGNDITPTAIRKYASRLRQRVMDDLLAEAKDRATGMEKEIYDQMVEGGWHDCFENFVYNLAWAPAAFIKGPIMRRVTTLRYEPGMFGTVARLVKTIKPTFESVSPFDIYPSRDAVEIDDGELCERLKLAPNKLANMKGVPGYQDKVIDKIIAEYETGGHREFNNTDSERARLEHKGAGISEKRDLIEGVEYWGNVPGRLLKDKGVAKDSAGKPLQDLVLYESDVIVVGNDVVYAAVNPEMTGKRPYSKTCWHKKPGSFWGQGVPRIMRELQQIINATVRSLCFNMSQASGFQTIYNDINRLPPGETITASFPGKIHQFLNQNPNNSTKPMEFWQPNPMAEMLLRVLDAFEPRIDTITGIPRYSYGSDQVAGAGRTASGLTMLMSNAARGVKAVLSRIDKDIYKRTVESLFNFNMQFSPKEEIKGDVVIQCSGALSQIVNEQNSQRIMAMLNATANPADAVVVGPRERGALWREFVKQLQLAKDTVVKSDDDIQKEIEKQEQMAAAAEQQALAAQVGGQGQPVAVGA